MSIYATLFHFGLARFAVDEIVELYAQGVPAHIDHTGEGWEFLPPPVDPNGETMRAVVIVEVGSKKGTPRCGQEYVDPLLILTGKEWEEAKFFDLMLRIERALEKKYGRGPEMILLTPDGRRRHIYSNGKRHEE